MIYGFNIMKSIGVYARKIVKIVLSILLSIIAWYLLWYDVNFAWHNGQGHILFFLEVLSFCAIWGIALFILLKAKRRP